MGKLGLSYERCNIGWAGGRIFLSNVVINPQQGTRSASRRL